MSILILNRDAAVADADGDDDDTGDNKDDDDNNNDDDDDVAMLKKPMRKLVFLPEMLTAAPELGHPAHDTKLLRIMRKMILMKKNISRNVNAVPVTLCHCFFRCDSSYPCQWVSQ